MITDQQFNEWAQSSTKNPVLLVEITHKDGTVYLSDRLYSTGAGETPEHISYDVCLKESVIVERTLDQDSLGAVRVYNDKSLDHWLSLSWIGYTIEVFIGDQSWPRENFKRQYKSEIESFSQLSATSYEFKSTLATNITQSGISNARNRWIAGDHTNTETAVVGSSFGGKVHNAGHPGYYDRDDLTVTYNNEPHEIQWIEEGAYNGQFLLTGFAAGQETGVVRFSSITTLRKLKELFTLVCSYVNQPVNLDNLASYPIDPNITFFDSGAMTFPEFLTLTLETLGALLWINDEGEIEFYRKEIPSEVSVNTVTSWITPNDKPLIQTITTEDPASVVQVKNPDGNHNSEDGPTYSEYNALDLTFPFRALTTHSYAENSYATTEARRLADLLSVTRRTYSVSVERITPELFIGAIVNIYSPKDRWNNGSEGLNALVVGFTQSFKSNKSELIVWR